MKLRIALFAFSLICGFMANALTLKKTTDELRTLIGDTISFKFDDKKGRTHIPYICSRDTVWKKSIKDKSKAKLNKHFTIKLSSTPIQQLENTQYRIVDVVNRTEYAYNDNFDVDVYIVPTNLSTDTLIWKYESAEDIKIFSKRQSIKHTKGWKHGDIGYVLNPELKSKYDKNDYRAYKKVYCDGVSFWYGCYMIPHTEIAFKDDEGNAFNISLEGVISPKQFDELQEQTLARLKKEGRYHFQLSKIEKPQNPTIRHGKFKEVVADDAISKYLYEDNVISILWSDTKDMFVFLLKNNSENSLKVVWDEAAFVNENNESGRIIHKGVAKGKANESQTPTVVLKGTELSDLIAPVDRLDNWLIPRIGVQDPKMAGKTVKILLPIEIKGVVNEYIFTFDIVWRYTYPELQE